jgi:DNA-binding transcriptional regulator YiaG
MSILYNASREEVYTMGKQTTVAIVVPKLISSLLEKHSKTAVAKYCGVSWMTVFHWSKGTFNPSEKSLTKLLEMYDAKPEGT